MKNSITPGIPDAFFIRGSVPMTKEEVRIISVSKLGLGPSSVVLDIGAGTGSVSVEIARLIPGGIVYSVEKESKAIALIKKNIRKFDIENIRIIKCNAPDIPGDIIFDRVFIGGSGGRLKEILAWADGSLPTGGRIVVNAVTLETLEASREFFAGSDYEYSIVELCVTRCEIAGKSAMMRAENPVFIISGEKKTAGSRNNKKRSATLIPVDA